MKKERTNKPNKLFFIVAALLLIIIAIIVIINVTSKEENLKTALIINNKEVTERLKKDIFIDENSVIYLSKEDIANFFDEYICIDNDINRILTTYGTSSATISLSQKNMTVNGSNKQIIGSVIDKDNSYYLPFSEMKDVYNVEIKYIPKTNIVTVDSLDKEQIKATAAKNLSVKASTKFLAKTMDNIKKGEKVVYISSIDNEWAKVRTENGKIGYVKEKDLTNKITVREDLTKKEETKKISLVWDYYSEYAKAPNRNGTSINGINVVSPSFFMLQKGTDGELYDNVKDSGLEYIKWAKENGYEVWPMFSNNSLKDTTSEILNNYSSRQNLIENIVNMAVKYNLDGVNIDFEYMYEKDKNKFSRFIIELAPRLKEIGVKLSVDVTAPDGSADWSLCYDRKVIGDVADYVVFMAYDQYGTSSNKPGTTAGYNWIDSNLQKMIDTSSVQHSEKMPANKIILGIPFYTRLWRTDSDGKFTSQVVNMKAVDTVLPAGAQRTWDEELKQNYVEYKQEGYTYQMWIEDAKSIKAKLDLFKQYKLAGVAFWEKDREIESVWNTISEVVNN